MSSIQKLWPKQTGRQYENITFPHTRAVNINVHMKHILCSRDIGPFSKLRTLAN